SNVPLAPSGSRYSADRPLNCSGERRLSVRFNAYPSDLGAIEGRNLVRFEPAVDGLTFSANGKSLDVRGAFLEDVRYQMTLQPTPILDQAGRTLEMTGPSEVHFRFERREPYFKWGAGQGIIERFSTKRVPIEGRGVEPDIEVQNLPVDVLNGRDAQLEAGIAEVMRRIEQDPMTIPPRPAYPDKSKKVRSGNSQIR
ncbi:MAG: hypothetical protein GY778_03460, partial [bacterium]|nr:hypothetical protein [bacterium]